MGKVIRREFLGSRLHVMLLCLTGIGIPLAVLYVLESLVIIEEEVEEPAEFMEWHRARSS